MKPIAIVNKIISAEAETTLKQYADVVRFDTIDITFSPLSGHIDIFAFPYKNKLILAPNFPEEYIALFEKHDVEYCFGNTNIGTDKKSINAYNVATNNDIAIHNFAVTDQVVLDNINHLKPIHCKQSFSRCSTLLLANSAITSDGGIFKQLTLHGYNCLLVSQTDIQLPGYKNGCFGGCCGILGNTVFVNGSLSFHQQGSVIKDFIHDGGYEIVELQASPLVDVGSIFFLGDF